MSSNQDLIGYVQVLRYVTTHTDKLSICFSLPTS